jgi:hypothetical protein
MFVVASAVGVRYQVLTDKQWELLELLLPKSDGRVGRNFTNDRLVVEGDAVPITDRSAVAGPVGGIRSVAGGVETSSLVCR